MLLVGLVFAVDSDGHGEPPNDLYTFWVKVLFLITKFSPWEATIQGLPFIRGTLYDDAYFHVMSMIVLSPIDPVYQSSGSNAIQVL